MVARLVSLITRPLWHDELFTVWAARGSSSHMLDALVQDSGPPLFYLLERPFVILAEAVGGDLLVRVPPFFAALLLFAVAASLARKEGRDWFLALAAVSPLLLAYSAEARAYAPLALLALLLFLLLFRGQPARWRLAAAAVVAAAALWTHYLAIFLVAACALLLLARRRFAPLAALSAGALLFLPWLPILTSQPEQATSWMREPIGDSVLGLFSTLGSAGRIPNPLGGPLPAPWTAAAAIVGMVFLTVAVWTAWRRRDREMADALSVTLLTMGLVLVVSTVRPVAFSGRSEMVVLPVWLWAAARCAAAGGVGRWLAGAAAAIGVVSCVLLLASPKPEPSASRAVAEVTRLARRQDQVVAAAGFYLPARLARERGKLAAQLSAFPPEIAAHPGWFVAAPPAESDVRTLDGVLRGLAPGSQAFLLLHPILRTPVLDQMLARHSEARVLIQGPDVLVMVFNSH